MNDTAVIRNIDELPMVLSWQEVAKVLSISRNSAYEVMHSKGFPAFTVGKLLRVRRDAFLKWMMCMEPSEVA